MRTRLWLAACAAMVLPRAYLAVTDQGMIWSDEIFQTLEQGHRLAFGYGLLPWEFKTGARSWLLPGAAGGMMKLLAWAGIHSGAGLAVGMKLCFAGLSVLALYPVLRMAHAAAGVAAAILLTFIAAAFPASLIYGSRAMSEVACTPLLTWGLWLLWPWGLGRAGRATWRRNRHPAVPWWSEVPIPLAAGALLGVAAVLRYQVVVLAPLVCLLVAWRRGLRVASIVGAGVVLAVGLGGLLDWATWHQPFHAFIAYVKFNVVENGANQWGVARRDFYWRTLRDTSGPAIYVLGLGILLGLRRSWPMGLLALAFIGAHSAIAHKELRFIFPVLPLLLFCSAVGLGPVVDRLPLPRPQALLMSAALGLGLCAVMLLRARGVTFADIKQPMDSTANGGPTSGSIWRAFDERNRLIALAGASPDVCGLAVPGANPYWTGGYTYFHRHVPILWAGGRADDQAANYVVLGPGHKMDDKRYLSIATRGAYQLYRRDGRCVAAPRTSVGYGRMSLAGFPGL